MTPIYAAVDQSPDPQMAVAWQERLNERPAIRAYKRHTYELVAGAGRVLDVGCGPGTDAAAIASAGPVPGGSAGPVRVVGLDPSAVMCGVAAGRGVTVCRGDGRALPFADRTFDACRSDRVVQHVEDPLAAVAELVRVTRLGGRVVVADPDQESLIVQVPGVPRRVLDQVKRLRRDVGYRNGRLAGEMPGVLASLGLADVDVAAFPLVVTDPTEAFGLPSWPRLWRDAGVGSWTDEDLRRWDEGVAAASVPGSGFVFALMYLVVTGVRR